MKKLFILVFFFLLQFSFLYANNEKNIIDLSKEKWEYRWGDSPFKDGIPLWSLEDSNAQNWHTIDFPANPENRNLQTNVWYRVKLPNNLSHNAYMYILSIDLITQVYLQGKQIYHFGEFDAEGKGKYQGWPWHLIPLSSDSGGEYLYFRIYSDYIDIGFFGEILISTRDVIFERLLKDDIPKIMVASIAIFSSILFLLSFLSRFRSFELFILGLLFLTQGLNVLFNAKILEIYFYYPLFKQYILAIAFFFFPIGIALFLDKIIKHNVPFNFIKRLWQIHLIYLLIAIFGSLFGFFSLPSTYEVFDIFYNFISLPLLTIYMIYLFFKGDKELKIVTFSFLIISFYWLYSSLIAAGLVPWAEYPSDVAVFACLLFLAYSIVNKLNYTQELEELSSIDYLTKLYNRKELDTALKINENIYNRYEDEFSIILLDIDDFKKVNDNHGHLIGDKLLIEIAEILNRYTREADIVGRWGGEEFLIICPKTNTEEAINLAENLRKRISENKFSKVGYKTASFGISSYKKADSLTTLISRVDKAMYLAKSKGKNRVEFID